MVQSAPVTYEDRREALQEYLDLLRQDLALNDWDVTVSKKTPDDAEAVAEIHFAAGQRVAKVRVATEFWFQEPEKQRDDLVHELVHIHLKQMALVMDSVEDVLGPVGASILGKNFNVAHEYATDAIALVIAQQIDPPKFPGGKK